jgi:carboxymethylenebutenolidase
MKTMVKEPIVHHVPTMTGGIGFDQVYNFYKTEFVGKMPNDTKIVCVVETEIDTYGIFSEKVWEWQ